MTAGLQALPSAGLVVFAIVYALAVAAPGPGVAAVVAQSLSAGTRGTPAFILGFVVGDLVWFAAAATGLSVLAQNASAVFVALKYLGATYLFYLAYRMWTSPAVVDQRADESDSVPPTRLFVGSLVLTLGNPKTMIFFVALLPTVVDLQSMTITDMFRVAGVIAVVLPAVFGLYVLAAVRARRLLRSLRAVRIMNRVSAIVMAGAAVAIVRG